MTHYGKSNKFGNGLSFDFGIFSFKKCCLGLNEYAYEKFFNFFEPKNSLKEITRKTRYNILIQSLTLFWKHTF
jgi:hypothetical protein